MELLQHTATLPGGSGQCNSCNALPPCLGTVGRGTPGTRGPTSWGDGESCPGGRRRLKSGTPAMHCLTAQGQWAVKLLQCTASLPGGSGQWNSCYALPHCLGAVGSWPGGGRYLKSRTLAVHCSTACGQWAVEFLQRTASLPGGSGQCSSCSALPHRMETVASGTPAMRRLTMGKPA